MKILLEKCKRTAVFGVSPSNWDLIQSPEETVGGASSGALTIFFAKRFTVAAIGEETIRWGGMNVGDLQTDWFICESHFS